MNATPRDDVASAHESSVETEFFQRDTQTQQMRRLLGAVTGLKDDAHGEDTPQRFIRMLAEMTSCSEDWSDTSHLNNCIKWKMFPKNSDEMIVLEGIPFVSLCNHHLVPFAGKVHIGYVPREYEAGL